MKKILGFFTIAIMSSIVTILGYNYFNNEHLESQNTSNSISLSDKNIFKTVDFSGRYDGNTGITNTDFTDASKKSVNAVVHVNKYGKTSSNRQGMRGNIDPFELFFGRGRGQRQRQTPNQNQNKSRKIGSGSGVIISKDGYIVTNNHVIENSDKLEITLNNQKTYEAKLIGTDPNTDIALLKIDAKNLDFLTLSDSNNIQVGQWVLAIGNPFNLTSTVTAGIISAKGRDINILSKASSPIETFIQTDAVVNPGNSGGALVNSSGDLIGINTAISTHTGSYEGYSFAVPSNIVKKVVEDILEYGIVQRAYLGVNIMNLTKDDIERSDIDLEPQDGVYIANLSKEGSAKASGIEKGDIIKKINNIHIRNTASLQSILGSKRPGDKVKITILRDGKLKTFNIKLKNKEGNLTSLKKEDMEASRILGAEFKPLTSKQKKSLGISHGVRISNLSSGKLLRAGLREGNIILKVNGKKVNSQKEINAILNKDKESGIYIEAVDSYGRINYYAFARK